MLLTFSLPLVVVDTMMMIVFWSPQTNSYYWRTTKILLWNLLRGMLQRQVHSWIIPYSKNDAKETMRIMSLPKREARSCFEFILSWTVVVVVSRDAIYSLILPCCCNTRRCGQSWLTSSCLSFCPTVQVDTEVPTFSNLLSDDAVMGTTSRRESRFAFPFMFSDCYQ